MNDAGHWTVPQDHPSFAGHFPGAPILPGVLLLDAALRAIAAATGMTLETSTINSVKFLSPAGPGESLLIRHERSANGAIGFEIVAGARKIASGNITPGPLP